MPTTNKKNKKVKKNRKKQKKFNIISVGSSTIDVFAKTDSELITIETRHSAESLIAYPAGSKLLITELEFHVGGGGTNTAVAFKRLGLNSAYLGQLGKDANTIRILDCLEKEKVKFIGIQGKIASGYSIVLDSIETDRTILTYKGANNNLKYSEINKNLLKTDWFYFSSMMGKSYKTLEKLSEFAKKNNINLAFNPSNYLCSKGSEFLKNILSNTYALILNNEEAELLIGKKPKELLLKALHLLGPEIIVVTLGKSGAIASDKKYSFRIAPPKIKVIETAGAGDAFSSGFITGLIKKKNIEFALKLGTAAAAGCISQYGTKTGLPSMNKAIKTIKSLKLKVKKKIL